MDEKLIEEFIKVEFPDGRLTPASRLVIAAVGTTAQSVITSPLFTDSLKRNNIAVGEFKTYPDDAQLKIDNSWTFALVLSPFKRSVPQICDHLSPTAGKTGVVDTLLRSGSSILGANTNAFAAGESVRCLVNGQSPKRVLVAGTGASARSVAVGVNRVFPKARIGIIGRTKAKIVKMVQEINLGDLVEKPGQFAPDVVINATTVGQTDDNEAMGFNLESTFAKGIRFFDLNIRLSALQKAALAKGCIVISGALMQILTNELRMALLK